MKKLISYNPANNTVVGEVTISTAAEISDKVKQANAAKLIWKSLGAKKRAELLCPIISILAKKEKEIPLLTTREMGKPIKQAKDDFNFDFNYLKHFLNDGPKYLEDEITFREGNVIHKVVYEPRGVVASITAWNFPLSNFLWATIPNLVAGNTVIFKHSEECPLIGQLAGEAMSQLDLPSGVFSQIYGSTEEGNLLVQENIDMIWFIGSSATGKKLYEIAGKKFIKSVLEMGGSNPLVIFEDVDIDSAVHKIREGRFYNSGQVCTAIKRVIVHRSLFESLVKKLKIAVEELKVGDPELESTDIGPLAAMRQLELLESQVKDSVKAGANIITGGQRPKSFINGAYYLPTILTHVTPQMRVWREEVFGPVLPIVPFDTEEEAIALANDSIYGLGATVLSQDLTRAQRVAAQIDAGGVEINDGNRWMPCTPFGGFKSSGMGCEHGRLGFHELCRYKVIAL